MTNEMPELSGRKVAIVGLAKSGVAAARLCMARGAEVTLFDRRARGELAEEALALEAEGARLALGAHDPEQLCANELVVVSPGVPLSLPIFERARSAGLELIGEVELAARFLVGVPLIGITGTNGKSTTTALAGFLAEASGIRTFTGGNLGRPLCEAALSAESYQLIVCELSSFQLEGIVGLAPRVAVVTNITPDHLDRYAGHTDYVEAKRRIFMNQRAGDASVLNGGDAAVLELASGGAARSFTFGFGDFEGLVERGARAQGDTILLRVDEEEERYLLRSRALRGAHNAENAMAALLAVRLAGVGPAALQRGLDRFPGLAHRLEFARTLGGVEYVNDSKATNIESTLVALRAFPERVWLIAGGRGKGAPYAPLVAACAGKLSGLITIGEDAPALEVAFADVPALPILSCGTLEQAVAMARERARSGDTVLLSPACASYDQYANYEERGAHFKSLVAALPEVGS